MSDKRTRALWEIGVEIERDWGAKMYPPARPYVHALRSLGSVADTYGADSADTIVRYFLANAGTWRGETARRVKAELKRMIK